jgi:hypothetical protein
MLLRSQSPWDTIPREIKEMILKYVCDGAGMLRQVNREWRGMIDQWGSRKTCDRYVLNRLETTKWACSHNIKGKCDWNTPSSYVWKHSPPSVILYLIEKRVINYNGYYLEKIIEGGRYDVMSLLCEKRGVKIDGDSVIYVGRKGHVEQVKQLMDIIKGGGYASYFTRDHVPRAHQPLQHIIKGSISRTDNCIVLKEFVERGLPMCRRIRSWIHSLHRPNTVQYIEDNNHRIKWADTS